jgi:hypothetical protein
VLQASLPLLLEQQVLRTLRLRCLVLLLQRRALLMQRPMLWG